MAEPAQVWIVDDDRSVRFVLAAALGEAGFRVTAFADAGEVLDALAAGRAHGHAIACSIEQRSDEVLQVGHGSLYPALQRLLKLGLIVAEDGISENNRKARFYRLTAKGRKHLFLC